MTIVDTHGHYVSRSAIAEVEKHPERFGIRVGKDEGGNPRLGFGEGPLTRPLRPKLTELEERRSILSRQRVDLQVVYTWLDVVGYSLPVEQGAAWCRLQNETMAADLKGKDWLVGLATVPLQSGKHAAEELSHAVGKLGLKGASIASNVEGRNLDDAEFAPFWETAEALGAPVAIHPYNVAGRDRMETYLLHNLIGNPLETTLAAASLVFGGIADRHPALRVILVHGGGCLPYVIGRLQWGYERYPAQMGKGLRKAPVHYLSWFYYDTLLYHTANIKHMIQLVGPERVLMGTDYPFPIEDPDPVSTVEKLGLSAVAREMIFEANPKVLFRL
ncbi:MAG: amidohydrolase family protein [Nitrospinota bacterium]